MKISWWSEEFDNRSSKSLNFILGRTNKSQDTD